MIGDVKMEETFSIILKHPKRMALLKAYDKLLNKIETSSQITALYNSLKLQCDDYNDDYIIRFSVNCSNKTIQAVKKYLFIESKKQHIRDWAVI